MKTNLPIFVLLTICVALPCATAEENGGVLEAREGLGSIHALNRMAAIEPSPEPDCPAAQVTLTSINTFRGDCRRRRVRVTYEVEIDIGICGFIKFRVTQRCRRRRGAVRRARRSRRCILQREPDCDSVPFAARPACGADVARVCVGRRATLASLLPVQGQGTF